MKKRPKIKRRKHFHMHNTHKSLLESEKKRNLQDSHCLLTFILDWWKRFQHHILHNVREMWELSELYRVNTVYKSLRKIQMQGKDSTRNYKMENLLAFQHFSFLPQYRRKGFWKLKIDLLQEGFFTKIGSRHRAAVNILI